MKAVGFVMVRNAVKYDYPVIESICSILPVCDQVIVLVGQSEDTTLALIQSIDSDKIQIHHSVWDDTLKEGGRVLAVETNKAFDLVPEDADWAFYIQADEVVHEQYHDAIRKAMEYYQDDDRVEGLLFKYQHFYGNYKYVGDDRSWYRREIRILKNDKTIRSYRDAQGFRKDGKKLQVKLIDAYIYHYGWVKNPYFMYNKQKDFQQLWHNEEEAAQIAEKMPTIQPTAYDFSKIDSLTLFQGTHPLVMQKRINAMDWNFEYNTAVKRFNLKSYVLHKIEKWTGKRLFEYRNYKLLR